MTLSAPSDVSSEEILDKLIKFAEENNFRLGGDLELIDDDDDEDLDQDID